jgi:hypothetical protein
MNENKRLFRFEQTIKKKIRRSGAGGTNWCGYLLPVEIVYIVDVWKLKPHDTNDWVLNFARKEIKEGKCDPDWFYFTVSNKDNERLGLGY